MQFHEKDHHFAELHNFAQFREHFSNLILKSVFKNSKINHWMFMTTLYVCGCVCVKREILR